MSLIQKIRIAYSKIVVSSEIDKCMSKKKEDMLRDAEVMDCVAFMEDEHKVLPAPDQHPLSDPSNNQEVELLALGLEDYID